MLTDNIEQPKPQTMEENIIIPLLQNIAGGVAVWLAGMAGVIAYTGFAGRDVDFHNAGVWCGLAGVLVFAFFTVIRFFGDDLGIVTGAYRMGWHARDAQVAALELRALEREDAAELAMGSNSAATVINKQTEAAQRVRRGALLILKVAFQGNKTTREEMASRGLGQRDFERARLLLQAAGVMDGLYNIVATEMGEAVQAVEQQVEKDLNKGNTYAPSW